MIAGIGYDLVDLSMFREQLADTASSFVHGTFTHAEIDACNGRPSRDPSQHLASRYAAKEAFIKAWSGSRFDQYPHLTRVDMRDVEVQTDRFGRPRLVLHGALEDAVASDGPYRLHISMTHDGPFAGATVLLERI